MSKTDGQVALAMFKQAAEHALGSGARVSDLYRALSRVLRKNDYTWAANALQDMADEAES